MAWQPQDEPLRQLAGYLRDSLNGYDRAVQKQAEQVSLLSALQLLGIFFSSSSDPGPSEITEDAAYNPGSRVPEELG